MKWIRTSDSIILGSGFLTHRIIPFNLDLLEQLTLATDPSQKIFLKIQKISIFDY